eukprot:Rhum_TRINITY_DN14196_c6_g1::Rhum_TRINITY_DN14196_c6_g1_i1::g.72069::m.72069
MAPWWTWPVVKASLAFLSMIFCIVAATVNSSAIKAEGGSGSTGIGIFTTKQLGHSDPVDFWGQDVGGGKELCKTFKIMWQSMQGCVVIAIIGCCASVACSLSLLAFKERVGARTVVSWIADVLALLGAVLLMGLLIVAYHIAPCPDTFAKDSLSDLSADLGCGVYLAGVSAGLIFVSLPLPARSGALKQARLDRGYDQALM